MQSDHDLREPELAHQPGSGLAVTPGDAWLAPFILVAHVGAGLPKPMNCDCHMEANHAAQKQVLRTLLAINAAMFGVEIGVGIWADSSGVIADSLDMLADALVYGLSLCAVGGNSPAKVRAAKWSGWLQVALALGIGADVIRRAIAGSEPSSLLMLLVSVCALAANAYCLMLLAKHREGEVHMRASWIFTRSDVIANAGVMVAALLVALTGTRWPDLIIGAAITVVVIKGGIAILADAKRAGSEAAAPPSAAITSPVAQKSPHG